MDFESESQDIPVYEPKDEQGADLLLHKHEENMEVSECSGTQFNLDSSSVNSQSKLEVIQLSGPNVLKHSAVDLYTATRFCCHVISHTI